VPAEPETIAVLVGRQAETRGSHPLLVCDDDRLSYADAQRRSADLARGLVALGAGKGTHVGLLHPNGSDFVVAMLAIARIGAVVVPFTTFATASELRDQLVHSDVTILLATSSYRGKDFGQRLSDIGDSVPLLRHALVDTLPPPGIDEGLLARVLYRERRHRLPPAYAGDYVWEDCPQARHED